MTTGMQFRMWLASATAAEKRTVAAVFAVLMLVVVTSVAIAPGRDAVRATEAAGPDVQEASPTDHEAVDTTGPATPETEGPVAEAAQQPDPPSGEITATSRSDAPAGSKDGAPRSAAVPLTASDRGVSPTEIKIGFLVINAAGVGQAGFALGLRTDGAEYAQALATYSNKRGGVAGRRVKVVARNTDPLSFSDQAAACQSMVNDEKVFGVVENGALADPAQMQCFTVRNKTPLASKAAWTQSWIDRGGGLQVSDQPGIERQSVTWVHDLQQMGWFDNASVVGIVGDNCDHTKPVTEGVLRQRILAVPGVKRVVITSQDCSIEAIVTQPGTFVPQMRAAGVTHVFLATNSGSATVFMQAAQNQGWKPKYTATDWHDMSADATAQNLPPQQFDGSIGITSLVYPRVNGGLKPYPGAERCNAAALEAGLEPLTYKAGEAELLGFCSNFFLMVDGINKAGPNPTRVEWARAIPTLGQHDAPNWGPSRFGPGKTTGGDTVVTAQWLAECVCWKAISAPRPAQA